MRQADDHNDRPTATRNGLRRDIEPVTDRRRVTETTRDSLPLSARDIPADGAVSQPTAATAVPTGRASALSVRQDWWEGEDMWKDAPAPLRPVVPDFDAVPLCDDDVLLTNPVWRIMVRTPDTTAAAIIEAVLSISCLSLRRHDDEWTATYQRQPRLVMAMLSAGTRTMPGTSLRLTLEYDVQKITSADLPRCIACGAQIQPGNDQQDNFARAVACYRHNRRRTPRHQH